MNVSQLVLYICSKIKMELQINSHRILCGVSINASLEDIYELAINEFGFRKIWRIKQIEEGVTTKTFQPRPQVFSVKEP